MVVRSFCSFGPVYFSRSVSMNFQSICKQTKLDVTCLAINFPLCFFLCYICSFFLLPTHFVPVHFQWIYRIYQCNWLRLPIMVVRMHFSTTNCVRCWSPMEIPLPKNYVHILWPRLEAINWNVINHSLRFHTYSDSNGLSKLVPICFVDPFASYSVAVAFTHGVSWQNRTHSSTSIAPTWTKFEQFV